MLMPSASSKKLPTRHAALTQQDYFGRFYSKVLIVLAVLEISFQLTLHYKFAFLQNLAYASMTAFQFALKRCNKIA